MVARPHAVDLFVEDTLAGADLEGRPELDAAHEDVVDPPERPVRCSHQRILRRVCVTRIPGMRALPSVPVADAHTTQRLAATTEAHAGRVGIGIEVTGQYHVYAALPDELLHEPRGGYGLKLPLVLEAQLVRGQMVDEQQWRVGVWCEDLRNDCRAWETRGPGSYVQVHFPHFSEWPATRNRGAIVLSVTHQTCVVVHDVEVRAEQIDDLIVVVRLNRFLESYKIGSKCAKTIAENRTTLGPCPLRPHRLRVATRTPLSPVTESIANLQLA
jgi:hypothetical protein